MLDLCDCGRLHTELCALITGYAEAMEAAAGCKEGGMGPPPVTIPRAVHSGGGASLQGLRLGIFRAWFEDASKPVVSACYHAVSCLTQLGAQVRP